MKKRIPARLPCVGKRDYRPRVKTVTEAVDAVCAVRWCRLVPSASPWKTSYSRYKRLWAAWLDRGGDLPGTRESSAPRAATASLAGRKAADLSAHRSMASLHGAVPTRRCQTLRIG